MTRGGQIACRGFVIFVNANRRSARPRCWTLLSHWAAALRESTAKASLRHIGDARASPVQSRFGASHAPTCSASGFELIHAASCGATRRLSRKSCYARCANVLWRSSGYGMSPQTCVALHYDRVALQAACRCSPLRRCCRVLLMLRLVLSLGDGAEKLGESSLRIAAGKPCGL